MTSDKNPWMSAADGKPMMMETLTTAIASGMGRLKILNMPGLVKYSSKIFQYL
jgi:hypothetical protein